MIIPYTEEEIRLCQGMLAFYRNNKIPFRLDLIDIFNAKNNKLYHYMHSIPYLDQIRTKKLFQLIILQNINK